MGCGEYLGHQGACRPDHRETYVLSPLLPLALTDRRADPDYNLRPSLLDSPQPQSQEARIPSQITLLKFCHDLKLVYNLEDFVQGMEMAARTDSERDKSRGGRSLEEPQFPKGWRH